MPNAVDNFWSRPNKCLMGGVALTRPKPPKSSGKDFLVLGHHLHAHLLPTIVVQPALVPAAVVAGRAVAAQAAVTAVAAPVAATAAVLVHWPLALAVVVAVVAVLAVVAAAVMAVSAAVLVVLVILVVALARRVACLHGR